ncbi:MAG TPA: molybdopterin cofactor-binding domain-containing protein, partial [Longimicrobiales bacterium]|nr:molybdopterin cofactor-binding domain-containing protein [Longimicrobiales bacterium]
MSTPANDGGVAEALAPDRHELREAGTTRFDVSRRDFLSALGGGIAVLCVGGGARALPAELDPAHVFGASLDADDDVSAWLHIAADGAVTVFTGKVEVGQGARTSLAQAVADELRVPFESVAMVMGDTARTPFDMGTFGSRSTPTMIPQLRRAAATARAELLRLAASRWGVDAGGLEARDGAVLERDGARRVAYGELTRGEELVRMIAPDVEISPPSGWTVSGTPVPKVGAREIVTGRHRYTPDLTLPGMLHGKVLRPSAFDARLTRLDTSAAESIPGVRVVRDGAGPDGLPAFVGVVASDAPTAARALAQVRAEWRAEPQPSSKEIFDYLKRNAGDASVPAGGEGGGRGSAFEAGSIEQGLGGAAHRLEARYTTAYIAHVPLEPRAAVARWEGGKLTVWTGTQRPFGVRTELARAFGLPEPRVRVIVPDTGSGYGGKHTGDAALEAARLAKAAGAPVKVVWTREEEFTWAYFRPAALIEVRAGTDRDGALRAWEFHNYNSGPAGLRTPYEVPNQAIRYHPSRSPLRQGSYRALAATANHFARESAMDELAHAAGMDPLAFRRRNIRDPRLRAVLDAAAARFGWGKKPPPGHGHGLACGTEKGGYVATCAEVAMDRETGALRVVRLATAFECGAIVNPDGLKNQVEGALVQGLGGALFEQIDFADGRVLNPRLAHYRVPRFGDVPALDTVLLDRRDLPSAGAGECPIVGVAPAIGNAVF